MKGPRPVRSAWVLPLPRFVLQPLMAMIVAAVHVYLAAGHVWQLFGGDVQWTHIWKGFGALAGAYIFAAIASRGLAGHAGRHPDNQSKASHVEPAPPAGP